MTDADPRSRANPRFRHFDGRVYSPRCIQSRLHATGPWIILVLFLSGVAIGWIVRGWIERGYVFPPEAPEPWKEIRRVP